MEPILKIRNLSISFKQYEKGTKQRKIQTIRNLSLEILPGQVAAVVGESGSGKSLLAHGILGILPYNSQMKGEILYDGRPLDKKRAEELRGREIALIPQGVSWLDPLMKVGPQLFKGKKDARTKTRYREALARYGLGPETEELYPFELSGGMARRVLIASAVAEKPRLVIADEPTPGLDERTAVRILGHFRELADEGTAVLLITHDLRLALTIADQVTVFYNGETIEKASPEDFQDIRRLKAPFTKALWTAMPEHDFKAAEIEGAGDIGGDAWA